MLRFKGSRIAV